MSKEQLGAPMDIALKALVFEMHVKGVSQDAIAKYVGKAKSTINDMLKPLGKWDRGEGSK